MKPTPPKSKPAKAVKAGIPELILDGARLDWLESHPFSQLICTNEGGVHRWICQDRKDTKTIACAGWTARAAIDEAMRATRGPDRKWDEEPPAKLGLVAKP